MTELGNCNSTNSCLHFSPHGKISSCMNWRPLNPRVEIWRFNDTTLTVARSDSAAWNAPDTMFTNVKHNGVWSSQAMCFLGQRMECINWHPSAYKDRFSDGTPVALYEGLEPDEC